MQGWRGKTYERSKEKQIGTNCMHIRYFLAKQFLQLLPLCLICGDSTFPAGQVNCVMAILVLNGYRRPKCHKGWICSSARLLVWLVISCGARDTRRSVHSATAFSRPETCGAMDVRHGWHRIHLQEWWCQFPLEWLSACCSVMLPTPIWWYQSS